MIKTINRESGDQALVPEVLESVFNMWWPKLEQEIDEILSSYKSDDGEGVRTDRNLLEEILTISRSQMRAAQRQRVSPRAVFDIVTNFHGIIESISSARQLAGLTSEVTETVTALESVVRATMGAEHVEHMQALLEIVKGKCEEAAKSSEDDDLPF